MRRRSLSPLRPSEGSGGRYRGGGFYLSTKGRPLIPFSAANKSGSNFVLMARPAHACQTCTRTESPQGCAPTGVASSAVSRHQSSTGGLALRLGGMRLNISAYNFLPFMMIGKK